MNTKKYLTKTILALAVLCGFIITDDVRAEESYFDCESPPETSGQLKSFLNENYSSWYDKRGPKKFEVKSSKNGKWYQLNTSMYVDEEKKDLIFYGGPSNVVSATYAGSNTLKGSKYRFLGLTVEGKNPFSNLTFPDDVDTNGDVKGRDFVAYPIKNRNKITTNVYKPSTNDWNDPKKIKVRFEDADIFINSTEAKKIYHSWLNQVDDKYSRNHDYYEKTSKYWKPRDTKNNWLDPYHSIENRVKYLYIVQPPTEFTYGLATEWHRTNSYGILYDDFYLKKLCESNIKLEDDFKATKLEVKEVADGFYEVFFKVKNNSGKPVVPKKELPTLLNVKMGSPINEEHTFVVTAHDLKWSKGQSRNASLGTFSIPPGTPDRTKIVVEAVFNNDGSKFVHKEHNITNNKKIKTVYTDLNDTCSISGRGTSKNYSVRVCTGWSTDKDGNTYCSSSACEVRTAYLYHDAEITYDTSRQTLMGIWSKNTRGHEDMTDIKYALESEPSKEKFNIGPVKHNVPGIAQGELRRIIRAGRPVQMYSTMRVKLHVMGWSTGELTSRKNEFVNSLIDSLKTAGIDVGDGAVTNHKNNSEIKAQVDKSRTKNGSSIFMEESSSGITSEVYGSSSCTQITRYERTYYMTIPIMSTNELGEQKTSHGDFISDKSYKVNNTIADFITNINNSNGVKGLKLTGTLDGKKIDSSWSGSYETRTCKTKTEKFGIQGNIFDDVRSEDQTNKVKNDKENWNF